MRTIKNAIIFKTQLNLKRKWECRFQFDYRISIRQLNSGLILTWLLFNLIELRLLAVTACVGTVKIF